MDSNWLNPAAGNGFWGIDSTFGAPPFIFKTTKNGDETAPYSNHDFLAGDVIVHSASRSAVPFFVNWTAPGAGTIDFTSALWYAQSPELRSNDITILLANNQLASITVNGGTALRSDPITLSGISLAVASGDVLAFRFTPTEGPGWTSSGSLAGISATVDFTASNMGAVPEPATWATMICGFGLIGGAIRLRRRAVALA